MGSQGSPRATIEGEVNKVLKLISKYLNKERKEKEAPRARQSPTLLRAVEKAAPRPKTPTIADHPAGHVAKALGN